MRVGSMTHQKGLFISFEGVDGSGKSTQARMLYDHLRSIGYPVTLTREPGDWSEGGKLRDILLNGDLKHGKTELFLFLADRCENLSQVILPSLSRGEVVLCDRYTDSTLAYQCFGRGFNLEEVESLFSWSGFPVPDITLLLSISQEETLSRMKGRGTSDRLESDLSLMSKVSWGFRSLSDRYPDRICLLDGEGNQDKVFSRVLEAVERIFR